MGQFLGTDQKKEREIGPIVDKCYEKFFVNTQKWSSADFYHAIYETVEEINRAIGSTQIRVPKTSTLEDAYYKHHQGKRKLLTKEEFQKILQMVILDTGVTNFGAVDLLLYMYGVPAAAWFVKQRLAPKLIPNEFFIPAVTSATVFLLAKLSKI